MLHNTLCSREKTQSPFYYFGRGAEFRLKRLVKLRREIRPVMTRLQNAQKQLNEAMAALESAASEAINVSHEGSASANPSQMAGQKVYGADLSALVDEVSIIEAKLSEAVAMIASVDSSTVRPGDAIGGDTK